MFQKVAILAPLKKKGIIRPLTFASLLNVAYFDQVNAHVAGHLSDLTDNCVIFILKINSNSNMREKIRSSRASFLYSFIFYFFNS